MDECVCVCLARARPTNITKNTELTLLNHDIPEVLVKAGRGRKKKLPLPKP